MHPCLLQIHDRMGMDQDMNKRILSSAIAMLAALLALSCGDNPSIGNAPALDGAGLPENLPTLANLDALRTSAAVEQLQLDPLVYMLSGGTVTAQAEDLQLDASADPASWALYSHSAGDNTLFNLLVDFTASPGQSLLLGVANYTTGRWQFADPYASSPANFSVNPAGGTDWISPAGNLYFVLVSRQGQSLLITDLRIIADVPEEPTYSVTGNVKDDGSQPLAGVTITVTPGGGQVSTDAAGDYILPGLVQGEYLLTPSLAGYTFNPPGTIIGVINADINGINFTGTGQPVETYRISGHIEDDQASPLSGVTMSLIPGGSVQSDVNGDYEFTGLTPGPYQVSPALAGYSFDPTSRPAIVVDADLTGLDFTGTPTATFSISGTILDDNQVAMLGVTVTLLPDNLQIITNSSGEYEYTGMAPGNYSLTPDFEGYSFAPVSRDVTVVDSNITGQDFTGTEDAVTVSYSADLLPIINGTMGSQYSCLPCHSSGSQQNGLDATDYNDVVAFSASINDRINRAQGSPGFMPNGKTKWQAEWLQDFQDWIDGGFAP